MLYSKGTPPQKPIVISRRAVKTGVVISVVILIAAALLMVQFTQTVSNDLPIIQRTLDQLMHASEQQQTDAAYSLFAEVARQQFPKTDLETLLILRSYLFEGYQSLTVTGYSVQSETSSTGERTTAEVSGNIVYSNGEGAFTSILIKTSDRWLLVHFQANVNPEKLAAWKEKQKRVFPVDVPVIHELVDAFMRAGVSHDAEQLYSFSCEPCRQTTQLSYYRDLLANSFYLFNAYQSSSVTALNIKESGNQTQAQFTADLIYGDGGGEFTGKAVKEAGVWKFTLFKISVDQSKVGAGDNQQPK